jgi:hypothetical protein
MGMIAVASVVALVVYGIYLGLRGAFAEMPPYMQGEGKTGRFDNRMDKAA